MVQISHLYMATGKTTTLTKRTGTLSVMVNIQENMGVREGARGSKK